MTFSVLLHVRQIVWGPVAKVLNDRFGIVNGLMTTVHALLIEKILIILIKIYVEHVHVMKVLFNFCWSSKSIERSFAELEGKLHGLALRVQNVSFS